MKPKTKRTTSVTKSEESKEPSSSNIPVKSLKISPSVSKNTSKKAVKAADKSSPKKAVDGSTRSTRSTKGTKSTEGMESTEGIKSTKRTKGPASRSTSHSTLRGEPSGSDSKSSGPASTMEDLLSGYEFNVPTSGSVVEGIVTEVSKKMVLVDIGAKTEGMVVDREYEGAYELIKGLTVGDKIKAIVVSPENDRGQILLSLRREASKRAWDLYQELLETEAVVVVRGVEVNRGGLMVRADGMRGFIPTSQFGKKLAGNLESLVNRPIKVKVIEVDAEKNRLIFSERHVSEEAVLAQKSDALAAITVGDLLEGTVSGVMPFGVFVTVRVPFTKNTPKSASATGQADKTDKKTDSTDKENVIEVDGLVHISEISWEKVTSPGDFFKQGDGVKVQVLSVDKDAGKLNLSVKRLKHDPWKEIDKRFKPGSKHKGEVTRVEPFGVFVNFEPGVDGLIHISKIPAGEDPVSGQKIDVYVETIDPATRRMSLSMVLKTTEKLIYK